MLREKKDIHVSQNVCNDSCQPGDWNLFPCEYLHTSCPGCYMDIKPTLPRRKLRVWRSWNPHFSSPSTALLVSCKQNALSSYSCPSSPGSSKRALPSQLDAEQEKNICSFSLAYFPTYNPWFWHPSAEAGEGNAAAEPGGPHASHYKNSHSCVNDSMGVSRHLVIRNTQHKTATSTGLQRYLCDIGAI